MRIDCDLYPFFKAIFVPCDVVLDLKVSQQLSLSKREVGLQVMSSCFFGGPDQLPQEEQRPNDFTLLNWVDSQLLDSRGVDGQGFHLLFHQQGLFRGPGLYRRQATLNYFEALVDKVVFETWNALLEFISYIMVYLDQQSGS
jgi:hypothetical protein